MIDTILSVNIELYAILVKLSLILLWILLVTLNSHLLQFSHSLFTTVKCHRLVV